LVGEWGEGDGAYKHLARPSNLKNGFMLSGKLFECNHLG